MHDQRVIERFWKKINKTESCWLWAASTRNGYGQFWNGANKEEAHRFSYSLLKGFIPKKLYVLHKCDITRCVNPNHLFIGAAYDNLHDAINKGKKPAPIVHKEKTQCPHGHPYTIENTNSHPRWGRHCLTCWRAK